MLVTIQGDKDFLLTQADKIIVSLTSKKPTEVISIGDSELSEKNIDYYCNANSIFYEKFIVKVNLDTKDKEKIIKNKIENIKKSKNLFIVLASSVIDTDLLQKNSYKFVRKKTNYVAKKENLFNLALKAAEKDIKSLFELEFASSQNQSILFWAIKKRLPQKLPNLSLDMYFNLKEGANINSAEKLLITDC